MVQTGVCLDYIAVKTAASKLTVPTVAKMVARVCTREVQKHLSSLTIILVIICIAVLVYALIH